MPDLMTPVKVTASPTSIQSPVSFSIPEQSSTTSQKPLKYVRMYQENAVLIAFVLVTLFTIACVLFGRFTLSQGLIFEGLTCVCSLMMDPYMMMKKRWISQEEKYASSLAVSH